MFGTTPAYRDLPTGVSDGDDIKQLKQTLIALGFAPSYNVPVDSHFDSSTQAAVERWQKSIGVTADGNVPFGQVIFEPAAVRIADWKAAVGDQAGPGAPIGDITGVRPIVTMDLDAPPQALAAPGPALTVPLPHPPSLPRHTTTAPRPAPPPPP